MNLYNFLVLISSFHQYETLLSGCLHMSQLGSIYITKVHKTRWDMSQTENEAY